MTPPMPMDEINEESLTSQTTSRPTTIKRMGSVKKTPYFTNLRLQLSEQLKSLDSRVETQVSLANELQDFFRKRAEVELESSRSLEKLAKSLSLRQKEIKQKKDQCHLFSVTNCWSELITETRKQSKEHAILAEIYSTNVTSRLNFAAEDLQRIYKQCKEIGIEAHEELLKVLHELHTSTKTFNTYQTEYRQTETKLKLVEAQKAKLEAVIPKEKLERSKKIRLVDKEIQKRRNKYTDARFKALKAKNEYILCMDAANAAVQKYFVDDLSDLIDIMDLGFYQCISRALSMFLSSQEEMKKSLQNNIDNLSKHMTCLDSRLDKQKFLEANNSSFIMPKKFEFQPPVLGKTEEVDLNEPAELEASGFIRQELEQRLILIYKRLEALRAESDELWKTLETAESSLMVMITENDYDTSSFFEDVNKPVTKIPEATVQKSRADRHETDEFHLMKFRDYMISTNRISRLQAKYDHIRKILGETDQGGGTSPALQQTLGSQPARKQRRKRIGQLQTSGIPRLFGGSIEEYIEATGQEIPLVLKSSIRVINLYGLHHQGIFRVSGSQVEINNFKECFERGEDPLQETSDASDINSVAGVLKLYLRELREPLFPIVYFELFMELAQLESKQQFVTKMKSIVKSFPRPIFIVLRYLFGFLNHLSENSDLNMMDTYNIAICFGPTLLPVPEDKDQVQYQNLVNELIKNVIIYAEDIFPNDEGGIIYEKYISKEPDEVEVGEAPIDQSQEEIDAEIYPSEDDSVFLKERDLSLHIFDEKSEFLEGIAQFDFTARSQREVSFRKGETVTLYSQISSDWWKGSANGIDGLIPDKYILIKIRDEDRSNSKEDKVEPQKASTLQHPHQASRTRTSSDSFLSTPKALSFDSSPSAGHDLQQHKQRRQTQFLQVKNQRGSSPASSNNSYLAVSGESLASSTSPESPSEFGSLDKEPMWPANASHTSHSTSIMKSPLLAGGGRHTLGHPTTGHHNQYPSPSPLASNCGQQQILTQRSHQRSQSVSDERVLLSQPAVWREALMEEDQQQTSSESKSNRVVDLNFGRESPPPPAPSSAAAVSPKSFLLSEETAPLPQQQSEDHFSVSETESESKLDLNQSPTDSLLIDEQEGRISLSFSTPKNVENEDYPISIPETGLNEVYNYNCQLEESLIEQLQFSKAQGDVGGLVGLVKMSPDLEKKKKLHSSPGVAGNTNKGSPLVTIKSYTEISNHGKYKLPSKSLSKSEDFSNSTSSNNRVNLKSNIQLWELRSRPCGPDLVMDLPLTSVAGGGEISLGGGGGGGPAGSSQGGSLSKSPTISSSGSSEGSTSPVTPEDSSPDNNFGSLADSFARQNQSTLKKKQINGSQPEEHTYQNTRELFGFGNIAEVDEENVPMHSPQFMRSQSHPATTTTTTSSICTNQGQNSGTKPTLNSNSKQINYFEKEGMVKPHTFTKPQVLKKPIIPNQIQFGQQSGQSNVSASSGSLSSGNTKDLAGIKKGSGSTFTYEH